MKLSTRDTAGLIGAAILISLALAVAFTKSPKVSAAPTTYFILLGTEIACGGTEGMYDCGMKLTDCGRGDFAPGGPTIYCATNVVEIPR